MSTDQEFVEEMERVGTPDDLEEMVSKTLAIEGDTFPGDRDGPRDLERLVVRGIADGH